MASLQLTLTPSGAETFIVLQTLPFQIGFRRLLLLILSRWQRLTALRLNLSSGPCILCERVAYGALFQRSRQILCETRVNSCYQCESVLYNSELPYARCHAQQAR